MPNTLKHPHVVLVEVSDSPFELQRFNFLTVPVRVFEVEEGERTLIDTQNDQTTVWPKSSGSLLHFSGVSSISH